VPVGHFPEFVKALALSKQAAARANRRLGHLPAEKADMIDRACDLIAGRAATTTSSWST
jgi:aspartate ammonia-lyase